MAGGRVQLRGDVAADDERDELARVAAAIPGVGGVENLIQVSAPAAAMAD